MLAQIGAASPIWRGNILDEQLTEPELRRVPNNRVKLSAPRLLAGPAAGRRSLRGCWAHTRTEAGKKRGHSGQPGNNANGELSGFLNEPDRLYGLTTDQPDRL